jgi:hypothetical protein
MTPGAEGCCTCGRRRRRRITFVIALIIGLVAVIEPTKLGHGKWPTGSSSVSDCSGRTNP